MTKLLIVEDEMNLRNLYEEELIDEGYEVATASNGLEAMEIIKTDNIDLFNYFQHFRDRCFS